LNARLSTEMLPAPPARDRRRRPFLPTFRHNQIWSYFGPAFVASVAYIDPGNFATNILGGTQFGYRLLWVLLWSNAMAILIQYLSAKLGIVTGLTLPQNIRKHFPRPVTLTLWAAAEIAAIATDLAEFLGAAIGLDLLFGPLFYAHGWSPKGTLLLAALVSTVLVFAILALDLAGHLWLERGIIGLVAAIGLCYGFEIFLVHPDWHRAFLSTLIPSLDRSSAQNFHDSIYAAVAMLGATVMPHVVYLHSALVQPRLKELTGALLPADNALHTDADHLRVPAGKRRGILSNFLRYELVDVFVAMNGAWLINSAMILMAAVAFVHTNNLQPTIQDAFHTLGPLFGRAGDHRGLPRHQVPDLPSATDHDRPGDCSDCDRSRPPAHPGAVAGGAELCAAVRAGAAADPDQPDGRNGDLCQRQTDPHHRLGRRRDHSDAERNSDRTARLRLIAPPTRCPEGCVEPADPCPGSSSRT
jgi:NRAMP (natural resistance-associated macrophage protein)-like metal ion transporter